MSPLELYKNLADDTRLRSILLILQEGELCVCELTAALQETQPKVSRHLAQLRKCGILSDRRQGVWIFYQLHPELPEWMLEVLKLSLKNNREYLAASQYNLSQMRERPERVVCG